MNKYERRVMKDNIDKPCYAQFCQMYEPCNATKSKESKAKNLDNLDEMNDESVEQNSNEESRNEDDDLLQDNENNML